MKDHFRLFIDHQAYHQTTGFSEDIDVVTGVRNTGGNRKTPSTTLYTDLILPHHEGHTFRFGVYSSMKQGDSLPLSMFNDTHFNQIINIMIQSGYIPNAESARRFLEAHTHDTLTQALGLIWSKAS